MRNVAGAAMVVVVCLAVLVTVFHFCACTPAKALGSAAHNADLAACRESSKAYRDAGPDAELADYNKCADAADARDRGR